MSQPTYKPTHHKTKIVATVGPACETYDQLKALVIAGVNVFRLNFSHGSHEDKKKIIDNIRGINKELGCTVAILGDLQGPKLRVGEIENNRLDVKVGDVLTLSNDKCIGTMEKIYVSYPNLAGDVVVGNTIMIDDGKIEVKVKSVEANGDVKVTVSLGGIISSKKGLNLPDTKISLPALTEKDLEDAAFIMKEKLDWVALSFVKRVADIEMLREILNKHNSKSKIVAKIEMPEALTNIEILLLQAMLLW
jgi:pyruvate kinase